MRRVIIMVSVAMMFIACTQREEGIALTEKTTNKIYATIESSETKVELNSQLQTVWTKNDVIVVNGPDSYAAWKFDGETGDRSGSFTKDSEDLEYPHEYCFDKYYAVYSNDGFHGWSRGGNNMYLYIETPNTQSYKSNSYGLGANFMLGVSDDAVNYTFKNLMGYLRLSITGDKVVESIDLIGNDNETLSGTYYFNAKDVNNLYLYSAASTTLTLECGEGVPLTDEPVDFYFVLPPTTFNKGITINVKFTDGTMFPQSTSKEIDVLRNTIQPMGDFSVSVSDDVWQTLKICHTSKNFQAPFLSGSSSSISGYYFWGDDSFSLLRSDYIYVYEDQEASHTITVKVRGANAVRLPSCDGVTELDLTNF